MANYDLTYEGSEVQGILDTGEKLKADGYILMGGASPSTLPGTPTKRVAYIGGPGTYSNFGSTVVVPSGSIGVFKYDDSQWVCTVISPSVPVSTTVQDNDTTVPTGKAVKTAVDGAVDTLQGLIDGITDNIENGYVYAGIATPTTTPVTGKVFYLALQAGQYTHFDNTAVMQGINIFKYNGSSWLHDAYVGISDKPIPSDTGLVKAGGTFDFVMDNGSAFDISKYFASGSTLATYENLSAALTDLDGLDAAYKRGGMSVKYVQSSDNKYVQFRYVGTEVTGTPNPFLDTANWQGVDDTPTAGSKNIVESGGVAAKTNPVLKTEEIALIESACVLKSNFSKTTSSAYKMSDFIPVTSGEILKFKGMTYTSVLGVTCYSSNSDSDLITTSNLYYYVGTEVYGDITFIVPLGVSFVRICQNNPYVPNQKFILNRESYATQSDLNALKKIVHGGDCVIGNGVFLVSNFPNITSSATYYLTDFVPVEEGDVILISLFAYESSYAIMAYTSNTPSSAVQTYCVKGVGELHQYRYVVPNGIHYLRFCSNQRNIQIQPKWEDMATKVNDLERLVNGDSNEIAVAASSGVILISNAPTITSPSIYTITDYISVSEGDRVTLKDADVSSSAYAITCYSAQTQESFIAANSVAGLGNGEESDYSIVIPSGVNYIKVTAKTNPIIVDVIRAENLGLKTEVDDLSVSDSKKAWKGDMLFYTKCPAIVPRKPCIIFQMDGNQNLFKNVYDYVELLKQNHIYKSTFLILPTTLTDYGNIVNNLYQMGNEIALHGEHAGSNFNNYIDGYLTEFAKYGLFPSGYVELGTQIPSEYLIDARKYFAWIVKNGGDYGSYNEPDYLNALQSITDKPYQLKRLGIETYHTDYSQSLIETQIANIKNAIDETITNGDVLVLYGHSYNQITGTSYTVYQEVLEPVLTYLKTKLDTMKCVTGTTTDILNYFYSKRYDE